MKKLIVLCLLAVLPVPANSYCINGPTLKPRPVCAAPGCNHPARGVVRLLHRPTGMREAVNCCGCKGCIRACGRIGIDRLKARLVKPKLPESEPSHQSRMGPHDD